MKFFLLTCSLLLCTGSCFAQNNVLSDTKTSTKIKKSQIFNWFNEQNYFELNSLSVQDKAQLDTITSLWIDALVGEKFKRFEQSYNAITKLLGQHKTDLSQEQHSSLESMLIANLSRSGKFQETHDYLFSIDPNSSYSLGYFKAMAEAPKLEVSLPAKDVELPAEFKKMGRGEHLHIQGEIGGESESFIFDTGCIDFNFVSEEFAQKHQLRVILDSLSTIGATGTTAFCAVAVGDELRFGEIEVKNPLYLVYSPEFFPDSIELAPVLGTAIMEELGEIHILPQENKIIIPQKQSPTPSWGQNMLFDGSYYVEVEIENQGYVLLFDTGAVNSDLNQNFYDRNKRLIKKTATKDSVTIGGFASIQKYETHILPEVSLRLGDRQITLKDIDIIPSGHTSKAYCDGDLGMDFVRANQRIIINFDKMFIITQ